MTRTLWYGLSVSLLVSLAMSPTLSPASNAEVIPDATEIRGSLGDRWVQTAQGEEDSVGTASEPAPEPAARDYVVFFDFDRTEIRPDAASILDRVAKAIFSIGSSNIILVGHTDASGPTDYNQWLSERRAFAVREYLLGKGIASAMVAKGRGEEDPRVAAPDGVREQENRRVEIHIN